MLWDTTMITLGLGLGEHVINKIYTPPNFIISLDYFTCINIYPFDRTFEFPLLVSICIYVREHTYINE